MKICQIYNNAAHYRKGIFTLMDCEFNCDYVFGSSLGDIKQMDTSEFRGKVTKVKNSFFLKGFYWQPRVQSLLNKDYNVFIMLGDTRCLSTWLFCLRARLFHRKKRIFFWTHGWYGKESPIEKTVKKMFFKMANGGIFLYGNYARTLMIREGFEAEKLFTIHNSLAYDQQLAIRKQLKLSSVYKEHFGNEQKNLIFVGRLTKVKHLDMILQAMHLLNRQGQRYNLTLIGDGEQRAQLEALMRKLGLEEQVWFYGACYDERTNAELIFNADLCVSPGNVGLTAIHSLMFGTPVVTHDDFPHQMPEFEAIQEGETGTFFKRGSIDSLAEVIAQWFADQADRREEVRQACYQEIDTQWTPQFQIEILKNNLKYPYIP